MMAMTEPDSFFGLAAMTDMETSRCCGRALARQPVDQGAAPRVGACPEQRSGIHFTETCAGGSARLPPRRRRPLAALQHPRVLTRRSTAVGPLSALNCGRNKR